MEVCPSLSELDNYVRTNKWYALGLQLGIEDKELEAIEKHRGGDIDECRRAMFRSWLSSTSNPCRKELLNTLRRKAVYYYFKTLITFNIGWIQLHFHLPYDVVISIIIVICRS